MTAIPGTKTAQSFSTSESHLVTMLCPVGAQRIRPSPTTWTARSPVNVASKDLFAKMISQTCLIAPGRKPYPGGGGPEPDAAMTGMAV
jgi:hypothetical protein